MSHTVHAETLHNFLGKSDSPISHNGETSVDWLLTSAGNGTLETGAREYQREKVASVEWKQKLLRTVLADSHAKIPQIHLRVKSVADGMLYFEAIDGQQRITSLVDFLNNKFPLAKGLKTDCHEALDVGGMTEKDLREKYPQVLSRIKNYRITTIWYENLDDDQVARLFTDVLNNVNGMKAQEIRNAIRGLLSTYIRDNARFETPHKLFDRWTKDDKAYLTYLPKLELKGRMEADEWLSHLIYMNEHGPANGSSNQKLTKWIRERQTGTEASAAIGQDTKFRPLRKRCDALLDFSYKLVTSVDTTNEHKLTPAVAMIMILYGSQLEKTGLKIVDAKAYTNAFFDVIARWSDTKKKLYINQKELDGTQMPPISELFGGKNSNAVGTIFWVLDKEYKNNPDVFGTTQLDHRASFTQSDILKKWAEQKYKCFYTGRLLTEDELVGDHYIPRSWGIDHGGVTEYTNLVVTDAQTNLHKLSMHGDDFIKKLNGAS